MPSSRNSHAVDTPAAPTRREALALAAAAGSAALAIAFQVVPARSTPADMKAAIARVVGEARLHQGRVKIEIPPLVENGNTVPCTVSVASPMTDKDHVKAIHVFNEKNPQPNVIACRLGPRAGRAVVSTRIRLNDTQTVVAVAEMSDGTFWTDEVQVIITLGACLEDVI